MAKDFSKREIANAIKQKMHEIIESLPAVELVRQLQFGDSGYAGPKFGGHLANNALFRGWLVDPDALKAMADPAVDSAVDTILDAVRGGHI